MSNTLLGYLFVDTQATNACGASTSILVEERNVCVLRYEVDAIRLVRTQITQ